jgi:hypothetical protein
VDIGIDMFTEELKSFKLQLDVTYASSRKGELGMLFNFIFFDSLFVIIHRFILFSVSNFLAKVQSVRGPMKGSSSQLFSQTLSNFHKV